MYDFTLSNGRTPLEDFIANNPFGSTEPELDLYRNLLDNVYGVFEVEEIELGQSLVLRDLQSGQRWPVQERTVTFTVVKGSRFFGRVGKAEDHYELIGADPVGLPSPFETARTSLRDLPAKLTPKVAYESLPRP